MKRPWLVVCSLWFCLSLLSSPSLRADGPTPESASVIYYDYPDAQGQLHGGRALSDPTRSSSRNLTRSNKGIEQSPLKGTSSTLTQTGNPSNRVNVVFVGDGYTQNDMPDYVSQVDLIKKGLFQSQPFSDYADFFNVYRVNVVSGESGITNDPKNGVPKKTELAMNYWCDKEERRLCIDATRAYQYAALAPGSNEIFALANSSKYGGAGYPHLSTIAGRNFQGIELALHELGHSFAGLADEYDYGMTGPYTGPEFNSPNISIKNSLDMVTQSLKWFQWFGYSGIGAYEGAGYYTNGVFRPTKDSRMRTLGQDYGPVNTEQLILNIYKHVKLIDDGTPVGTFTVLPKLFIKTLQPFYPTLVYQWSINGKIVSGAKTASLDTTKLALTPGTYAVTVQVQDMTPKVRDGEQRKKLMTDSRTWALNL